jgi:hypothetical protein
VEGTEGNERTVCKCCLTGTVVRPPHLAALAVEEVCERLLALVELPLQPLQLLEESLLVARWLDQLCRARIGEYDLDALIDRLEAHSLRWQLFAHLLGADEERLEVAPLALDLCERQEHLGDHCEALLPARDLFLKGREVA